MICLICNESKKLNRGICQPCRDKIIRPHYIAPFKPKNAKEGAKNGK